MDRFVIITYRIAIQTNALIDKCKTDLRTLLCRRQCLTIDRPIVHQCDDRLRSLKLHSFVTVVGK